MNKHYQLLYQKQVLTQAIKDNKKQMHHDFAVIQCKTLRYMDIIAVLCILLNFFALMMTNVMVMKEAAEEDKVVELLEANPVMAKTGGYEQHPDGLQFMKVIIRFAVTWSILAFFYIHYRRTVYTEQGLNMMIFLLAYYVAMLGYDFFNNFGYLIGRIIFGG